jgi:hypothetical protein
MLGGGDRKELARYMAIGQVGLEMAAPPALGVYLDMTFGWSPWGVVVGAAVGLIGGLAHLIHLANKKEEGPGPSDKQKPS